MGSYNGNHAYIIEEEVTDGLMSADDVVPVSMDDYKRARELVDEFRKRRAQLGKPVRKFYDPETAKKDLEGQEFFLVLDEVAKLKNRTKKK